MDRPAVATPSGMAGDSPSAAASRKGLSRGPTFFTVSRPSRRRRMAGILEPGDDASRFEVEARQAGLALPTARRLNPGLALAALAIVVAASLAVGYSTGWMNLNRPHPGPLSQLPGCSAGGIALEVATESGASAELATAWPSLASAFSAATGNCLSVSTAATSAGFAGLTGETLDALVGPELPGTSGAGSLSAETFAVPLLVSPVVVLVNTGDPLSQVQLSAAALAGAYLGTVTSWADPLITGDNPGLDSDLNVTVVHLDGPVEANAVFSTYLAQWNATFRATVVPGPNTSWPVGPGATSPSQVSSLVASTPGAIGYEPTDVCPSLPPGVECAAVQSGSDTFVAPTAGEVSAAADLEANSTAAVAGDWVNVTGVAPLNSTAYPMVETTYGILYRDLGTAYGPLLGLNASKWLIALLFWVASDTSDTAGNLATAHGYDPLPAAFALEAEETVLSVTYLGSWILLPPSSVLGESEGGGETGEF